MSDEFIGSNRYKELLQIVRSKGPISAEDVHREYLKILGTRASLAITLRRLRIMANKGKIRRIDDKYSR